MKNTICCMKFEENTLYIVVNNIVYNLWKKSVDLCRYMLYYMQAVADE